MITFSQIPLSEIELGRIDAEYYRPDLVMLSKSISNNPHVSIRRAGVSIDCSAFYPSIVPYYDFEQNGVPFLRVNEIQNGLLSLDEKTAFLPEEILQVNRSTIATCEPGDLIIAKGGNSLGKVALLTNLYPKYAVCRDVLVVRTRNLSQINRFFLWLYLHSASGQSLLIRTASQTGQPHLTIESIARLKIPLIPNREQEEVERNYLAAEAAMETSRNAYTQAQQLLEAELGLDKLRFDKPVGYTARFSELELSHRTDAEFFNPEYQAIIKLAEQHSPSQLGRLFSIHRGVCIDPKLYNEENGRPYIRIKELSLNQPLSKDDSVRIGEKYISAAYPQARVGDYILAVIGATIGKINLISEVLDGSLFSNNTACLSPKMQIEHPNAYELLLRSEIIQKQIQQRMAKTAQEKISDSELKRILVPTLRKPVLEKLENFVVSSKQSHFLSKQLLEQAKFRVEQLIEKAVQK